MLNKFLMLIVLVFFIAANNLFASEPVVLEYADSLVNSTSDGIEIKFLQGNVRLRQGNVTVNCDYAAQYILENRFKLSGNVVLKQNTLVMRSPEVWYDGNTSIADAQKSVVITDKETTLKADKGIYSTISLVADFAGNVVIEDDSVLIYADAVNHDRKSRISIANGNVVIKGKYSNTVLEGDSLTNIPALNYSIAEGNARLFQIDSVKKSNFNENEEIIDVIEYDTLFVKSQIMEAWRGEMNERYKFSDSVEIIKGSIAAKSERALYYKDKQYFALSVTPILWYDRTQLHADSITVFIPNNKLSGIDAIGKAFSASKNDSLNIDRIDQLSGDTINIVFSNDSLSAVLSRGNSKSVYFMTSESGPDGLVRTTAAEIQIRMKEGEANEIIMVKQVPGEYFPEKMASGKAKEYYLQDYRWSDSKPKKPELKTKSVEKVDKNTKINSKTKKK